ncbi:MAG: succinate dehydrogenase iron-sulfur subunit [Francisellaceae bacterium]|jgi:succinate dehydrogenase / fumarate reductase, iron-sulfur subunit|nr:succinate dehydrogenase iron-sulfur subunit [Francisellaceae bacterium]MBT6207145.1 succinate dehydrogenase iron-sulfur subunit [Francisellaceae bacterium]MBT6539313.1 succinate dehydrogenase iron-sulfur subunit [Francisellaceae bacterium]
MHFSIYKFDPESGKSPSMVDYEVSLAECDGVMLLDALQAIKRKDSSLSFRRSCGEGVCGSDGMNINGKNGLACITPLSNFIEGKTVKLRPLPGMPVVRDLVVDMTNFFEQYKKVKPFLQNDSIVPSREFLQSPKDRAKLDGLYECVLCGCCSSACPSYWWNPDKFLGPAAALQGARFILDSRDDKTKDRLSDLEDPYKIFRCRSIMSCADACPKGLNPTKAIGEIRRKMLDEGI